MNGLTDQQLLSQYAAHRSESAFSELVRRHIDLIHSVAVRRVRDGHLAQDVTQAVFLALAQNAGPLSKRPVLVSWLHRTAQNLSINIVRSEARRRAREHQVAAMNELFTTDSEPAWEQIAPHLDAALGQLNEVDRETLLLRHFQEKSAREIAQVFGISNEAAQKRVNRAEERLREYFAGRGVAVGAGALAASLSVNAVQVAPAGLSVKICAAAALAEAATHVSTTLIFAKLITMPHCKNRSPRRCVCRRHWHRNLRHTADHAPAPSDANERIHFPTRLGS